jgi:hypothetical protein
MILDGRQPRELRLAEMLENGPVSWGPTPPERHSNARYCTRERSLAAIRETIDANAREKRAPGEA